MIVSRLAQDLVSRKMAITPGAKAAAGAAATAAADEEPFPTRTHLVYGGLALAGLVGLWLFTRR